MNKNGLQSGHQELSYFRLDLSAIEVSLRAAQAGFSSVNAQLKEPRDTLSEEVLHNMLRGYTAVDEYLRAGIDIFSPGNSDAVLELNRLVLCGDDPDRRRRYRKHIVATEKHFYGEDSGGFGSLMEWLGMNRRDNVWMLASGLYLRVLSHPQLFIEGNHRTAVLMLTHLLASRGYAPFVLDGKNSREFYEISRPVTQYRKNSLRMLISFAGKAHELAGFFEQYSDPKYLKMDC
ncbi:MAG: hypothetical protein KDJ38_02710 [Gammaproteobacteria bacterium]|nr:hypothetical protein [Gammaproteobacteria bacterium]